MKVRQLVGLGGNGYDKQVFIVLFHPVLFPGEFFEFFGAGKQFVLVLPCPVYFLLIKGFLVFQLVYFGMQFVLIKDVVAVEKKEPGEEENGGNDVFVAEPGRQFESLLHFHVRRVLKSGYRMNGTLKNLY